MIILRKNRSQEYKIIFIEKNIMKRRKNMLVGSTKKFRISYYLSSFIPSYMFLLIILLVQHYETTSNFLPLTLKLTSKKVVFILILILFILSCLSLCYVKVVLKNISNNSSSRGIRQGYITRNYNVGMREFLLSVLIPIMTTISVQDIPRIDLENNKIYVDDKSVKIFAAMLNNEIIQKLLDEKIEIPYYQE